MTPTYGDCDGVDTSFNVTVNPLPVVTLVTNKINDEVCIDDNITFTTQENMTDYIWDLGGATTTTSGGVGTSNTATLKWNTAGTKTVSVNYTNSNGCTAATVTTKQITVLSATTITTQPTVNPAIKLSNGYIIPGSNVELNVTATGAGLTYQWYWKKASDGTVVELLNSGKYSGTTSSQLVISNAYDTENGDYYVAVTGCGTVNSYPVTLIAVASQDASLRDLKLNGTTLPDFNPGITSYLTTVACDEEQVTILGIPNNPNYTNISGNGTYTIRPGDNYLTITVVAQDMVTTMSYTVNVVRDCYLPKILKNLEDAVICIGESHTFEIIAEGENLTYEWYCGNNRIVGANSNTYTVSNSELRDYERYYVIVRNNYNGYKSSIYSNNVSLWVADYLPETLKFSNYPASAITGKTYYVKLAGYPDVTKYGWSYRKTGSYRELQGGTSSYGENDGVIFSPAEGGVGQNETWATFGTLSEGAGAIIATLEHPCGTREVSQIITVKYPTGLETPDYTATGVYPNPTLGIIKVSNTRMNLQIRITDVTGSLKGTYPAREGTTTIDLTGYAKGTYMLQYNGKTFKVIKR
ncbi:MAG: T9SS type A sorting domain-containing protein [Dysgonamonadaceae bacterium]|nr:T9SS type A sorting domain-containing protein [Dysgonamonadaceae bacterium]